MTPVSVALTPGMRVRVLRAYRKPRTEIVRVERTQDAYLTPATTVRGLWVDNAGCDSGVLSPDGEQAHYMRQRTSGVAWSGLYFGGVAFKYQAPVDGTMLLPGARLAAASGVDVVTTSGDATGEPCSDWKANFMRAGLGDHALAVASGVTVVNVGTLLPFVDAYLVASGIEERFGHFDEGLTRELIKEVHRWTT